MKVIENLDTLPESINTPSYDQRFRSHDLCKLGCCWKFPVFWTDRDTYTNLRFELIYIGELLNMTQHAWKVSILKLVGIFLINSYKICIREILYREIM
jgi:hypothetical protein